MLQRPTVKICEKLDNNYGAFVPVHSYHGDMKTILCPIDFSKVSRQVMAEAAGLASALKGRVVLLHVVQPPVIVNEYGAADVAAITLRLEQEADRHLARLKKPRQALRPAWLTNRRTGSPVWVILDEAKKISADYIVLGSHGHTAFYDLLVGSTAEGVLKKASCPVLIVPQVKLKSAKAKR